ncbi:MAG: CoA-binding protein [Deltaproteobacteria bacterium HGW-Deltaproteobacteria-9]|nr:MAG: CoA-binding protein [Deltaproteobacteria bacterium HGW-Deltaproteobacteria-9]
MNPKSVATAGAGNNPSKMGTLQALSIIKDGYQGKFYPVHPTDGIVLGHKAYASALDLPEPPDLAMLVVPTKHVIPVLEDFGRIGTRRAIVITAGFKETGAEGRSMEDRLNEIADRYGIRFLGPNCMGMLNTQLSLNLTVANLTGKPGSLGMASQSGTYVTQTLAYLRKRGIRFSKAISVGNEANINIIDALEYLGEDEHTKAIILYIEGIRDGRRFIEVARKITPRKPVLAQYVGGSGAGARAGLSHTGAMAGPDFLYDGIFKQAGVIRLHSIEDLYSHGWAMAAQPPLRGRRVGVMTNSGGPGTAISHNADMGGLDVPRFSDDLQSRIRPLIQGHASSANPVDLTFHLDMQLLSTLIPEMIMQSGEVDGVILHGAMSTGFMREVYPHLREILNNISEEQFIETYRRDLTGAVSLPRKYGLPLLVSSFFGADDAYTQAYQDNDIPVFDSPEKAARAMASFLRHKEIRDRKTIVPPALPDRSDAAAQIIKEALQHEQQALDEFQAKRILSMYGIRTAREMLAGTAGEAVQAAREIGYPVAAKACSWEIMHKTGKGLIALNLQTEKEVRRALQSIRQAAGANVPVLIQEMLSGAREFVAGMTRFDGFGPCVLFGLGGVLTEALKDTALRSAPLSAVEAQEMLTDIRAGKLIGEFRGMPAVDTAAIAGILQGVGFIALLHPEIAEIDLNPIIIAGSAPVVADALFVLG